MSEQFLISGAGLARALARSTSNEITKRLVAARKRGKAAVITVTPCGTVRARYLVANRPPRREKLQQIVGGCIEAVDFRLIPAFPRGRLRAYAGADITEDTKPNYGASIWLRWPYSLRGTVVILTDFVPDED